MTHDRLNVAIITGSTRRGRFGPTVTRWFADQARMHAGFDVDVVDLAEIDLPDVLNDHGDASPEQVERLAPRLAAADAFVVVTCEYNHSYPAPLKTAIDWYRDEWQGKAVGFVSYGGLSGGLRAVEHLRTVFAEMHSATIRETVSFHRHHELFGPDGEPIEADGANAAAKKMLDQLEWWARALSTHRSVHPYAA